MSMSDSNSYSAKIMPYFMCSLASLFYVYDFVIRVLPGTIVNDLMLQYHLSAAGIGLLSSFFYFGYMLMQVPCGLFYDRFGPRRLLTITCLLAAVATFFFIDTNYFAIAAVARLLMGIGSAFAYIGALVLASRWLPMRYYVITAGLIQLMGSIGAIIGEAPIAKWVEMQGSVPVTSAIAVIGIILAILFWFLIRDYPVETKHVYHSEETSRVFDNLKHVLINRQSWAAAIYGFAIWAPIAIFGELWVVPFLATLNHMTNTQAASLASLLWVGVGIGGPIFGWLSNVWYSRRKPLMLGAFIGMLSSLYLFYSSSLSIVVIAILLFLFGFAGSAQAVTFGVVQDNNPPRRAGTAAGFNNMAIVVGGSLLQPLVGFLLKSHANVKMLPGIGNYLIEDYRYALMVVPICFCIAFLTAFKLIRDNLAI